MTPRRWLNMTGLHATPAGRNSMYDGRTDQDMVATELLVDHFISVAGLADG
jgi:hypothetical protein